MPRTIHVAALLLVLSTLALFAFDGPSTVPPGEDGGPRDTRGIPMQLNHQGVVMVAGERFNGNGFFRFALVDSSTGINAWTNDGTHVGTTGMPAAAVGLVVINGIYNVALGDTSQAVMVPLTASAFNLDNLVLRIWFDDGVNGVQLLAPDQKLTTVPYAFRAVQADNGAPVGTIVAFGGANPPAGWLLCDGSAVNRTEYAALFEVLDTAWGAGNGSTTFHLPDLRGRFLRGVNDPEVSTQPDPQRDPDSTARSASNTGGNTGNNVGSVQEDEFLSHRHGWRRSNSQSAGMYGLVLQSTAGSASTGLDFNFDLAVQPSGGSETRPKNVYVNYIIKY